MTAHEQFAAEADKFMSDARSPEDFAADLVALVHSMPVEDQAELIGGEVRRDYRHRGVMQQAVGTWKPETR